MELEMIHWIDHWSYNDRWNRGEVDTDPIKIMTVGWVLKETKETVTIIGTTSESGAFTGHLCILKKAILRRWKLKDPGKKLRKTADG